MIRLATVADGPAVAAIYGPVVSSSAISFEVGPPTADEMAERIAGVLERTPWLVYQGVGGVLGFAYATKHRDRAAYRWGVDVSVYVAEEARRGGMGRALYRSLIELLRLQGYYTAYAGITLPNPASVGLHEALGFRPVGVYPAVGYKGGGWHSVGWWRLELREPSGRPAEPRSLDEVKHDPGFAAALRTGAVAAR